MLQERRISSVSYDKASDSLSIAVDGSAPHSPGRGRALVSAAGKLVGLDLRNADGVGEVLMHGEHEDVATTADVSLAAHPFRILNASRALKY